MARSDHMEDGMVQTQQDTRFNQAFKTNDAGFVPFGEVVMHGRFFYKGGCYERKPSDPHGFNAHKNGNKSDKHKFKDTELVQPAI